MFLEYERGVQDLIVEWQTRYDETDKGEWTKFMIPDLDRRCALPLQMDHYTSQFLTGHGDFNAKLHSFKLVQSPNCACGDGKACTSSMYEDEAIQTGSNGSHERRTSPMAARKRSVPHDKENVRGLEEVQPKMHDK